MAGRRRSDIFIIFAAEKNTAREKVNLVIDIGNTLAKLAAFDGDDLCDVVRTSGETLNRLPDFVKKHSFDKGIVSTVSGISAEAGRKLEAMPFPLLYLKQNTPVPVRNDYKTPETLGTDRLAAVVGAVAQFPGRDILVVDAGTCLTFEVVDRFGCYKGGAISPGLQMRLKALHAFTARLPLISVEGDTPEVGYDTETSIRSGVIEGMKCEIEGRILKIKQKYPDLLVILTGGDVFNFEDKIKKLIFADKYIVPKGLNKILLYNNE